MELFLIGFLIFVLSVLALDLGVFHRHAHVVPIREALAWTSVWITLALLFNVLVYLMYERHWLGMGLQPGQETTGQTAALKFLTGYIVEESLSLDNVFVIALIFSHFHIPGKYQHRVLFWGILGAIIMRGIMIATGIALIRRFEWIIYVFGAFLVFTAIKMIFVRQETFEPERNPFFRIARRIYPVSPHLEGESFFTRIDGKRAITRLFLVLVLVESSDVLFAVDSIPAIFAITQDPFIVFTSNIFAILGLRSMYFLMAGAMEKFRYLKTSLAFVLGFVGVKMLMSHHHPIPIALSLSVILGLLSLGIFISLLVSYRETAPRRPRRRRSRREAAPR
jgi:tellurite resistance protein TerC